MKKFFLFCALAALGLIVWWGAQSGRPREHIQPSAVKVDKVIVQKTKHIMTLHEGDKIIRSYKISIGGGGLERKQFRGDNKTPEGLYIIDGRNEKSAFYRSLHISYPSPADTQNAKSQGRDPGDNIMIHGMRNGLGWIGSLHRLVDWTAGCIAVTDAEMDEIWTLVPNGTPIEIQH